VTPLRVIWVLALLNSLWFWSSAKPYVPWAFKYPRGWQVPLKQHISAFMRWLAEDASFGLFTFKDLTRAISWGMEIPLQTATSILSSGFVEGQGSDAVQVLPPLSWIAVIAIVIALGRYARDWKLAALVGGCFGYLAVFGQWNSAMVTLSSIVIAVPFGVAGGLLTGIAAYRYSILERLISPVLDLMQTVPVFAYLVPILLLFGFNPVAAMIATIIYAMPPMVRITLLAFKQVPREILDLGTMVGCSKRQMTWKVLVPSASAGLMVGVNQVIMLSLNMVIIASMIGAGGLGFDVLSSLRRLDIGAGIEAGVAIVVLAIALDRLSQAFAERPPPEHEEARRTGLMERHPYTLACGAIVLVTSIVGLMVGWVQSWPQGWSLTTGDFWADIVRYINVNFFDELEAVKTFLLLNIMIPLKRFLISLPWPVVAGLLALAGYSLAGWRLGALCGALTIFIAAVGLWTKAMVTVYLCGIAVIFACLIGIPIGIIAASRDRLWRGVQVFIDTLQTLPSFVYLMPVVMLFRVGDFTAMIAVIAYAIAPAIRYTAHGLRHVDPQLVEAGIASGCTSGQLLRKIKLRLALPEILLGLNQTIMLALSMLVITALVGTRELGQEVYIALTKADTGRGIVAGLCVAFIAIIADRLITAGARRMKQNLGLS
jgi:glycine betaine/proline transport system permease protein